MAVDHVLPEHLLDDETALKEALALFGLPSDFDLNSFENWLPAHGPCNNRKHDHVFRPTPLIQVCIDQARENADKAREICDASAKEDGLPRQLALSRLVTELCRLTC